MPVDEEKKELNELSELGYRTIKELETEQGILASGRSEIYGCIFGRDSLITAIKLIKTYEKTQDAYLLSLTKKILTNLAALQGKAVNIENGEEPGKCIHEYRPTGHEHLTKALAQPWYVQPDGTMKNYDTVDATPLFLMAVHAYYAATADEAFAYEMTPFVRAAIDWILNYGDGNRDGFIDYQFAPGRTFGGLRAQSWMDSTESIFHEDGSPAPYPIAPVEVQAYVYTALRAWGRYFMAADPRFGRQLLLRSAKLKRRFNERYVITHDDGSVSLAFAIDGDGKPLTAARSSMGHVLWALSRDPQGRPESILERAYIPKLAERLMAPDLFEPSAGMRTLSSLSSHFDPGSYHNGSIWPHDTAMVIDGLKNFRYFNQAAQVRRALLAAYRHFKTPIELFVYSKGEFSEYQSPGGQKACQSQAWSAASLLFHAYEQ